MKRSILAMGIVAAISVSGCGSKDPFGGILRLSQAPELAPASATEDPAIAAAISANIVATAEPERPSTFSRLFSIFQRDEKPQDTAPSVATPVSADAPETDAPAEVQPAAQPAADPPARRGFFARLLGGRQSSETPAVQSGDTVQPGGKVALGSVARVCNLANKDRGSRIGTQAGFTLYDSFPNSTASRPFYLTGFSDGCARQVTGALVMFGDAAIHERHLYSQRSPTYKAVDTAYEQIKSRVCNVGRGKPCGAQMTRLNRTLAFVTVYPEFETSGTWAELLLSSRKVQAVSLRD